MPRIHVGEGDQAHTYEIDSIEDVPNWGLSRIDLLFARIKREEGIALDLNAVFAAAEKEATGEGDDQVEEMTFFVGAVLVWMARMTAGERIGFEDANDFSAKTIRFELTEAEQAEKDRLAAQAEKGEATAAASGAGVRPTDPASAPE